LALGLSAGARAEEEASHRSTAWLSVCLPGRARRMSFDLSLVGWNTYLSSHAGRDKVGKFVHYLARAITGLLADRLKALSKGSPEHAAAQYYHDKLRALFVRIMDSRRTVRWFSSLGIVITLRKGPEAWPWKHKPAFFVSQLAMLVWHYVDHYRWLQTIGWLQGDQLESKRVSFSAFSLAAAVQTVYYGNELREQLEEGAKSGADADKQAANALDTKLNLAKSALTLVSVLHVSELWLTHEFVCGITGAAATVIDIYQTFPRSAQPKKE
jgi:hypothetical protein